MYNEDDGSKYLAFKYQSKNFTIIKIVFYFVNILKYWIYDLELFEDAMEFSKKGKINFGGRNFMYKVQN